MDPESVPVEGTEQELFIEVVNRSKSYKVSKKLLCSSIPYFEKMFCCDLLESKESKVTLDLDESGFNNILSYVYTKDYVLSMRNVIGIYDCCDYLMLDALKDECSKFFSDNFNIYYLPMILKSSNASKLFEMRTIECFIRRHFLKIAATRAFLEYPFEVIEYICSLDLLIESEYQVFSAIHRWIRAVEGRMEFLERSLKLIRWCAITAANLIKINETKLIPVETKLPGSNCQQDGCLNRCIHKRVSPPPIVVYQVDDSTISIVTLEDMNSCFPCGLFTLDTTISMNILTDESNMDIIYDSGRKGIRVDWKRKKFNQWYMIGTENAYYGQIYRYIIFDGLNFNKEIKWVLENPIRENVEDFDGKCGVIDFGECIASIGFTRDNKHSYIFKPCLLKSWFYSTFHQYYQTCLIKDTIYIIENGVDTLSMLTVNTTTKSLRKSNILKDLGFLYHDLIFFEYKENLLLCQRSSKKIYQFRSSSQSWVQVCQLKSQGNPTNSLLTISSIYSTDVKMVHEYEFYLPCSEPST